MPYRYHPVLRIAHERMFLSAFDNVIAPLEGLHMSYSHSLYTKSVKVSNKSQNSRQIRGYGGVDHC